MPDRLANITLHHSPESRSMKSLWLLNELGLNFDLQTYGFGEDLRTDNYLSIHPLGRVPSLEVDGLILFESGAIAEYLGERCNRPDLYFAPNHPNRAAWLQWLHYSETMAVHLANLTQQFIALRDPETRSPVVIKLETRRLEKAIEVVENQLSGQPFILGERFTIADIGIGYALYIGRLFTDLTAFPRSAAYLDRLMARAAFGASLPLQDEPRRIYTQSRYRL